MVPCDWSVRMHFGWVKEPVECTDLCIVTKTRKVSCKCWSIYYFTVLGLSCIQSVRYLQTWMLALQTASKFPLHQPQPWSKVFLPSCDNIQFFLLLQCESNVSIEKKNALSTLVLNEGSVCLKLYLTWCFSIFFVILNSKDKLYWS